MGEKPMTKTNDEILGTILKGVGSDFDPSFFNQNLIFINKAKYY